MAPMKAAPAQPNMLSRKYITGAAAQPSEPPTPWMLKARPSRPGFTEALSNAKSAGWNTELPRPAITAMAAKPTKECATDISASATPMVNSPPARIGRAPKRSTAKPAPVWAMPETP